MAVPCASENQTKRLSRAPFEPFAEFIIVSRIGEVARAADVLNSVTTTYRLPGKRFHTYRSRRTVPRQAVLAPSI